MFSGSALGEKGLPFTDGIETCRFVPSLVSAKTTEGVQCIVEGA